MAPQAAPDLGHWPAILSAVGVVVGFLIMILLWYMSALKDALRQQGEELQAKMSEQNETFAVQVTVLFAKVDGLAEKKVSGEQCKEYRRLCYQYCPVRQTKIVPVHEEVKE